MVDGPPGWASTQAATCLGRISSRAKPCCEAQLRNWAQACLYAFLVCELPILPSKVSIRDCLTLLWYSNETTCSGGRTSKGSWSTISRLMVAELSRGAKPRTALSELTDRTK